MQDTKKEVDRMKNTMKKPVAIPVEKLRPFAGHPFKVKDDDEMNTLIESIQAQGVLSPLIVRPIENTDEYEVISGHRRLHATQKAGITEVPALIYGRSLRIPMKPLSTSRPLIWRRKSAAMYGVIQTAGAKRLPSQDCSIVPIAAARCMSTAPTMARGFLNIPVPIIPKFRVGHYAIHNTVSMRVLF